MTNQNGEQEFDPFAQDKKEDKARRPGAGVAWLALLLALILAGFTGYRWWQEQGADAEADSRQAMLQALQQNQAGLEQSVRNLQTRLAEAEQRNDAGAVAALGSQLDSLQGRVAELGLEISDTAAAAAALQEAMVGLDQRLAATENSVAALAARGDAPGKSMDLSEVQHLLQLASERLQLFGDPRSADRALAMADARLENLEDPLYLPVRRRITDARQALAEIRLPDPLQLAGRLTALQSAIPGLPFPGELPAEEPPQAATDAGLWERFKRTMAGLVTVRRKAPDAAVALSLEDQDYIRQGLWLQLESARLALMRNDASAYAVSLQRAADTLATRFSRKAAAVSRFAEELESLAQLEIVAEMPDISAPWAQLRLLREGRESALGSPSEAAPETLEIRPANPGPDAADTDDAAVTEAVEEQGGNESGTNRQNADTETPAGGGSG